MNFLTRAAATLAFVFSAGYLTAADVTEQQWVRASENGEVKGRVVVPRGESISSVRGAKVSLIDQNGKFAADSVKSDNTGRFVLKGVHPGVYSLLIQGEKAFACCAMHVVDSKVPLKNEFEIAAGSVDISIVQDAVVRYLPNGKSASKIDFDPATNPMATDRVVTGELIRILQHEGGLKGRLTKAGFNAELAAVNSNVMIYRDGAEVARTTTDSKGNFVIKELAPGSYTVLGSGADGFGVMGLELVDPLSVQTIAQKSDDPTLVAQYEMGNTFVMQIAPTTGNIISDRVISEQIIDEGPVVPVFENGVVYQSGYSVGGGAGGAGGGVIGGGGRLGRLVLWGGVGTAIALAASDDDGTPPVASPAVPAAN